MKKILYYILFLVSPTICFADGHLTEGQKKKTIECAGIYYANSMIPQAELELEKIVHSFAAKKFLSSYLVNEGVNKAVDKYYGSKYDEAKTNTCHNFVNSTIPNGEERVKKVIQTLY